MDFEPEQQRIDHEIRHADEYAAWTEAYRRYHAGDDVLLNKKIDELVVILDEDGEPIGRKV